LADSFYKNLEFGTGGLRGIMGVGTNRINKYTIGMATQGFATYLNKSYLGEKISVVVGHDSRNNSRFFASEPRAFHLGRLWKTPATAKGAMAPQGFSGCISREIVVFQSFPRPIPLNNSTSFALKPHLNR
jgi:hypothetical protein